MTQQDLMPADQSHRLFVRIGISGTAVGRAWSRHSARLCGALLLGLSLSPAVGLGQTKIDPSLLRISAARSAVDLGLVRFLIEEFHKTRPDIQVEVNSGGDLRVLEDGRKGVADLLITHHRLEEGRFAAQGYGLLRSQLMFTEYAVFGPPGDQHRIARLSDVVEVFRVLAEAQVDFVVPSPQSGTNVKIGEIWTMAGINPDWVGYENTGGSGYATLLQAAKFGSYTVAEMGTYLLNRNQLEGQVVPLYRGDLSLRNVYSATVVAQEKVPNANQKLATEFFKFLVSNAGQAAISGFGEQTFGASVLLPAAHLDAGLRQRQTNQKLEEKASSLATQKRLSVTIGVMLLVSIALFFIMLRMETKRRAGLLRAQGLERSRDQALDQNIHLQKEIGERKQVEENLAHALQLIQRSEAELAQEKERVEVTLHSIGDAVITTDDKGKVEYLNPVAERLTGKNLVDLIGHPIDEAIEILDETDNLPVENPVTQCLREQKIIEQKHHTTLRRHDDQVIPISSSAAPIRDREGQIIGVVMVFQDVTPARKLAQELAYQATHDPLTGLFNRAIFEVQLQRALDRAKSENVQHVLCYLDMDQFKLVNDTCGHRAGDELLRQIALLLQKRIRDSDVLARLGGDELGILLINCGLEKGKVLAGDILNTISGYTFAWDTHTFSASASIGLVSITADSSNAVELMSDADVACFEAKDLGRNRVQVYHSEDRSLEERRGEMQWVSRLTKAIAADDFELYVQPILPVADQSNTEIFQEVLIRLPDKGQVITPLAFLPAAERYNMMPSIDSWVSANVFRLLSENKERFANHVFMINVSGQSLGDESFLKFFQNEIESSRLKARQVCVEITETAAITNLSRAAHFISALKELGCRFALDDFGSGLSSFAYLKTLDVDFIKIDGSFVRDMGKDPVDRSMVEAIINIGRVVGTRTIAESVETEAVLNILGELGVDFAQGFFLGRPRPVSELINEPAQTTHPLTKSGLP